MTTQTARTFPAALDPTWLTGPIFDKELRVSSRRLRSYWLRFFYVLVLTIFIAVVWLSVVDVQGNATVQQARMAEAGKRIVMTVMIFQFVAMQVLAVILLSNAISDEVYHRTLGLLMTTPINGLQIVMGKVLSRLLQLILLLGITLPVLAVVRVLGGVSWSYLLSSLCITLTAAIFAGSLSLVFSINNRRAYAVIMQALFVLGSLYLMVPLAAGVLWGGTSGLPASSRTLQSSWFIGLLLHINPVAGIWVTTRQMLWPTGQLFWFSWPLHCAVLLGLSALVLAFAMVVVRKVALRQATGQLDAWFKPKKPKLKTPAPTADNLADSFRGAIKRVQGPPVVWRELRAPFIHGVNNRNSYIGLAITILALLCTYWGSIQARCLDEGFVHGTYVLLFVFLGTIVNTIFAATRITMEKESQSWLLLLATPLKDSEILFGKAVSAIRRCLPIWGLLAGHVILFSLVGYIHFAAIVHLILLVAWLTCFITGAGLYFGARFARTTSAVVAAFALFLGLWAVGPILVGLASQMAPSSSLPRVCTWAHPAVQAQMIMEGTGGWEHARNSWRGIRYSTGYPGWTTVGFGGMTCILAALSAMYIVVGLLFFWRAKCRLRRHVFT